LASGIAAQVQRPVSGNLVDVVVRIADHQTNCIDELPSWNRRSLSPRIAQELESPPSGGAHAGVVHMSCSSHPTSTEFRPGLAPEDVGFAAGLGDKLEAGRFSGLLRHLHCVLVGRAGNLVLERYYEGPDES
jgi:hypothetical protein